MSVPWSVEEADPLGYAPKRRWIGSCRRYSTAAPRSLRWQSMAEQDTYSVNLLGVGDHAYWPGEAVKGFLSAQVRALELLGAI